MRLNELQEVRLDYAGLLIGVLALVHVRDHVVLLVADLDEALQIVALALEQQRGRIELAIVELAHTAQDQFRLVLFRCLIVTHSSYLTVRRFRANFTIAHCVAHTQFGFRTGYKARRFRFQVREIAVGIGRRIARLPSLVEPINEIGGGLRPELLEVGVELVIALRPYLNRFALHGPPVKRAHRDQSAAMRLAGVSSGAFDEEAVAGAFSAS